MVAFFFRVYARRPKWKKQRRRISTLNLGTTALKRVQTADVIEAQFKVRTFS